MSDKNEMIAKIATGLETKLENALCDLRRLQNGANVHQLANVLCSVQAVLNGAKDLKGHALKTIFSEMKEISKANADLFEKVDSALEDGKLSKEEKDDLTTKIEAYQGRLTQLMDILKNC